ncbi:MAG: rRNA (guanosine2251-2-O)-methyltransferase, partial [Pseudomonadota bacterium]|nr:rRNA (guanosine2251-2-O)-methyltransferase [Pseudomonadota bacterium]
LARTMLELKERDILIVGTSDAATDSIHDLDLSGPVAFVLGAEDRGIRDLTGKTCDRLVRIPMMGAVESLNVSVASAVCLYEALRQRLKAGTATLPAATGSAPSADAAETTDPDRDPAADASAQD